MVNNFSQDFWSVSARLVIIAGTGVVSESKFGRSTQWPRGRKGVASSHH